MTALPRVIFIANDVVPGCGMPVAAPGLRVWGLAAGLERRGFVTTTLVVRGPIARQWRGSVPAPLGGHTVPIAAENIASYLDAQDPAVVVLTNANQIDRLPEGGEHRYIVDFFAPKLLERVYESPLESPYPVEDLALLRSRKLRAIERADGFIVNGVKKLPYFMAWILQTGRDLRTVPIEPVGMCLPETFSQRPPEQHSGPVRFALAGYLQGWSVPGRWLAALAPHLAAGTCTLEATMPEHWGGASGFENHELQALADAHAITLHDTMTFSEYRDFVANADVVLDLFERTRERELAMVTRTVAALCCGKPVVHPPFTEVAALIDAFDAGWLVDPADPAAVSAALEQIVGDPPAVAAKAQRVRELWAAHLDPAVAVSGLVRVIEQVGAPIAVAE